MTVRDVIIREAGVGSMLDNTETPDLLDVGSQQLAIKHPDDGHQDDGNEAKQGMSTAINKQLRDPESLNSQDTILRRAAREFNEATLDEGPKETRGSL